MTATADVLIIGAGIIGGSVAFHLLERNPRLRVTILEAEPEVGTGSTSKATGGVRFQFSTEANIRLTLLSYRTGFYVHRQGKSAVLMGGTDKDIKPGLDTSVDWEAFGAVFQAAAKRVPPLADAKVMRAYAGVRDLTPDYHGILGPARTAPGFHVACGFSGHGFMHAPAIGLLMAEIVLDGRTSSMDIDALSLDRFDAGTTRAEANMF